MKNRTTPWLLSLAAAALLAGCGAPSERPSGGSESAIPTKPEQACLRAVTQTTNNPDVVLLGSSRASGGTRVIVGVGSQRARWSCMGYSDGSTGEVMSLTDEGRL